jgi:hypothetical protein
MAFKVPKDLAQSGIACENCGWLESGRSAKKDIYFNNIKQQFNEENVRIQEIFTHS